MNIRDRIREQRGEVDHYKHLNLTAYDKEYIVITQTCKRCGKTFDLNVPRFKKNIRKTTCWDCWCNI